MTSTHGRGFKKRGGCWVAKPQTWKKWKFQNSQYVIFWWFWENQFGREFPWFGREFPWFGRELSWSGFGKPLKRIFVEPKKTWFFVRWIPEKNQNRDFVVFENPEQKKSWGILDSFGLPNSALKWIIFWGNSKNKVTIGDLLHHRKGPCNEVLA